MLNNQYSFEFFVLGDAARTQGNLDQARQNYQQALVLHPDLQPARDHLLELAGQ